MKFIIPKDKINPKYYVGIWFALLFVSLLYKLPIIYSGYVGVEFSKPGEIVLNVFLDLVTYGLFPTLMCFICSTFLNGVLWRRGIILCSRNDFIYYGMIFTGASRLIIGFMNIFSILNFNVFNYTVAFADEVCLTTAIYLMGIVLMREYYGNSYKKIYAAAQAIAPVYFTFLGIMTLLPAISNIIVYSNPNMASAFKEMMEVYLGSSIELNKHMFIAAIIAVCLYAVVLGSYFGVAAILKKKAATDTRDDNVGIINDDENKRPDDFNPFEEFSDNKSSEDENVFDEFDI